jgi:hypothetical protein
MVQVVVMVVVREGMRRQQHVRQSAQVGMRARHQRPPQVGVEGQLVGWRWSREQLLAVARAAKAEEQQRGVIVHVGIRHDDEPHVRFSGKHDKKSMMQPDNAAPCGLHPEL